MPIDLPTLSPSAEDLHDQKIVQYDDIQGLPDNINIDWLPVVRVQH